MGFRWGVIALVLCASLFGQEFQPLYLHCAHRLDGLTATQSRLRSAFWKATEAPEEEERSSEKKMLRWHKALLAKTEKLLIGLGIAYEPMALEDGTPALRVLPRKRGNELNCLVGQIREWLGTEFIYAPLKLLKPNGKFSRARFNRAHNRILLSHEFVDGLREDESLHHEILHAVFQWFRLHGIDSLFHGDLKAADADEDLWEGEHYQQRMSLEELATYPLNLCLFAKGLERFLAKADTESEALGSLLAEIERKAEIYKELTGQTGELLTELLREAKGKAAEVSRGRVALAPMNGVTASVTRLTFSVRHYLLRIPLLGEESVTTTAVLKRLATLNRVTGKLYDQNQVILRLVRSARKKFDAGDLGETAIEKLASALKGPRELTLPYLTSADGKPSREPEAKKLPRPELVTPVSR